MPTFLLLARHGETEDNARQIFQGQGGGSLNARGVAQAERLAARLASARGFVDAIVASDLARARETALIVARALELEVTFDPALREVDVGAWTGLSYDDVKARFPDQWHAWRNGGDIARGGGETYEALSVRVTAALARIAETHHANANASANQGVLVVSHGAALRCAILRTLGLAVSWNAPLGQMVNAAISTIVYDEKPRLDAYNDHAHLAGLDPPLV